MNVWLYEDTKYTNGYYRIEAYEKAGNTRTAHLLRCQINGVDHYDLLVPASGFTGAAEQWVKRPRKTAAPSKS